MNDKCPLFDFNSCKATGLYCFWDDRDKDQDNWCISNQNAYAIGLKDGVDRCTDKLRKMLEGYKNVQSDCIDN